MRVQVAPESVLRSTRALSLKLPLAYTVAGEEGEKTRSRKTPWAARPGSELQESPPFVLLRIPPSASVAHRVERSRGSAFSARVYVPGLPDSTQNAPSRRTILPLKSPR